MRNFSGIVSILMGIWALASAVFWIKDGINELR